MGRTCPVRVRGRFGFVWSGFGLDIPGIDSRKQIQGMEQERAPTKMWSVVGLASEKGRG